MNCFCDITKLLLKTAYIKKKQSWYSVNICQCHWFDNVILSSITYYESIHLLWSYDSCIVWKINTIETINKAQCEHMWLFVNSQVVDCKEHNYPLPYTDAFRRLCFRRLLKILWQEEKWLIMFSIIHNEHAFI